MIPTVSSQRHDGFAKVLLRCSEADSAATRALYQQYQPQLVRLARDLGADDPEGSADLAFFDGLQAIENLHTRSELSFRSYLHTATRNRVVSEHRRGAVETTPLEWTQETIHQAGVENEVVDSLFLETVLSDLTSDQRDVIVHRFFGGYTSEETAKRLGKSSSAVRRLQHTGLKSLRRACAAAGLIVLVVLAAWLWRGQAGQQRIDISPVEEQPNRPTVDRSEGSQLPSTTEKSEPRSVEGTTRLTSRSPAEGSPNPESQTTFVQAPTDPANQTVVAPSLDADPSIGVSPSSVGSVAAPSTSTTSRTASITTSTTTSTSVPSPVALADAFELKEGKEKSIKVLENDSERGAPLDEDTLEIVTPPRYADTYRVHKDTSTTDRSKTSKVSTPSPTESVTPPTTALQPPSRLPLRKIDSVVELIELPPNVHKIDDLVQGFAVTHSLVENDLLSPDGVVALADRLPAESAEPGLVGLVAEGGLDYEATSMLDAGPAVRELEGKAASLYLYNVERDPHFGLLLRKILAGVSARLGIAVDHIVNHEGYVFLTGGPAVTSAHVDHEYNFLLVVRGRKRVFIADVPSAEGERALEALHSGGYGACDGVPSSGSVFEIGPGEGVFIPPRSAHYVENGDEPCTALSVVFATEGLHDEARIYRANALLRRLGLKPSPPGDNAIVDRAKSSFAHGAMAIRREVRRFRRAAQ